jgi:hypothetical protein
MIHYGRQPAEHVRHGNPHPANRRSPATLTGFDGDGVLIVHRWVYFTQGWTRGHYQVPYRSTMFFCLSFCSMSNRARGTDTTVAVKV